MKAPWLSLILIFAICFGLLGCMPEPKPQKYIFPNGFSGKYRIIPDKNVATRLPVIDGVTIVAFDQTGNLWVNPDDYENLLYWGDDREFSYADGKKLVLDYDAYHDPKYSHLFPRIIYDNTQAIMVSDHGGLGEHSDGSYVLGYIAKNESEVKKFGGDYFLENGDTLPQRGATKP